MPANQSTPEVTRAGSLDYRISWPRAATPCNLEPLWKGEFASFDDWCNFASKRLTGTNNGRSEVKAICVDALGRRCSDGGDFTRARDEDAFPVRYFWECVPSATPARGGDELREALEQIAALPHGLDIGYAGDIARAALASTDMAGAGEGLPGEAEQAVMVCPQCDGEGSYADGVDENACTIDCTRCGSNGWIVDLAALASTDKAQRIQHLETAMATVIVNLRRAPEKAPAVVVFASAIMRGVPLQEAVAVAERANDPSSIVEVTAPPVEGLTSGEGEPVGAMLICDQTGGRIFTWWPVPQHQKQEADSIYGSHGGYRTVPLYAASPKATATASVREDRFANDAAAKALYDTWADQPGWVPWVDRGNSNAQERARREVML